jgi:molybdopterin molybdotransferase
MEDIRNELSVIETIPAGKTPEKKVGKNQCSRIMTGAMIPQGADCVLMVEDTKETEHDKIHFTGQSTKPNITPRATHIRKGQTVLNKGSIIRPQHIAVLATTGCTHPFVYKQPHVAVISTGDELVEPDKKPGLSKIRNSNGYQLIAQARQMGLHPDYMGIAPDNPEETEMFIKKALASADVILLTGGVSMGDFDLVPEILQKTGIKLLFDSIAVQPGKPTTFGITGKKYCFGLPGNPVSSFNQFELLVKPFLWKMMGHDFIPPVIRMPFGTDYRRKKTMRLSWLPVMVKGDTVVPVEYHGSAHINSFSDAFGLVSIAPGETEIKKGQMVDVRQI